MPVLCAALPQSTPELTHTEEFGLDSGDQSTTPSCLCSLEQASWPRGPPDFFSFVKFPLLNKMMKMHNRLKRPNP